MLGRPRFALYQCTWQVRIGSVPIADEGNPKVQKGPSREAHRHPMTERIPTCKYARSPRIGEFFCAPLEQSRLAPLSPFQLTLLLWPQKAYLLPIWYLQVGTSAPQNRCIVHLPVCHLHHKRLWWRWHKWSHHLLQEQGKFPAGLVINLPSRDQYRRAGSRRDAHRQVPAR